MPFEFRIIGRLFGTFYFSFFYFNVFHFIFYFNTMMVITFSFMVYSK